MQRGSGWFGCPKGSHSISLHYRKTEKRRKQKPKAPRLSIVVLPFDSLSDDPKQGYFADGITEDLITDLSRIKGAFVIARGTSFTYKGKPADPKAVAKELNVRYVCCNWKTGPCPSGDPPTGWPGTALQS